MSENKSRQPLLLFHQRELYGIAAQSLRKRLGQRPAREKLMLEGAECLSVEGESNGIPSCVFLINRDPAYIHNLLVGEDEILRPAYIVTISSGPKPPIVERPGVLVPYHCIRSVGRAELSKKFLLCEDLFFNTRLVDALKSKVPESEIFSERNALFSTTQNVEEENLDWLYKKNHILSFDRISAELLRVSKGLNLPVGAVHFVGPSDYTSSKLKAFCEETTLDPQLLF